MPKSSKQKNKKSKAKQQRGRQKQAKLALTPTELQPSISTSLEIAMNEVEIDHATAVDPEIEAENVSLLVTKPTAAQELQASLLAKQQQAKQWKQQLKTGKMVGAHVPKRFNRGG